ncbi:hypothetical protein KVG91_21080 [Pseudomonas sp. SWRI103]|uniref:DNA polymerase Y-family little finger domain-containing protein n=1 Tax=Pseudomonas azadiae TaxID=2843612 RepID=A0ABS6P4V3_9PSED|nr:hypothetical protein [Pseudomonas azadiae]NMF40030.1 hypothetical protein [Pseudomonas sp. SWRI 103]
MEPIKEAVATYTQRAAEKLRAQNSLCKKIRVSIRTGMFNPEEAKYANGALVELPYPTNDVRLMTKAATEAVNRLFRAGFKYSKAEVLLMVFDSLANSQMTYSLSLSLRWQTK